MRRSFLLGLLAVVALPVAVRAQGAQAPGSDAAAAVTMPSVTLPPELDRVLRDYERLWQARDATGLAGIFAADGFVLPMGRPAVRGRADITRNYANAGGPLSLRALAYATSDTVGYIIGAYAPGAGQPDVGKFVLALRRSRGGPWQIMADIDNPTQAPRRRPATPGDTAQRPG